MNLIIFFQKWISSFFDKSLLFLWHFLIKSLSVFSFFFTSVTTHRSSFSLSNSGTSFRTNNPRRPRISRPNFTEISSTKSGIFAEISADKTLCSRAEIAADSSEKQKKNMKKIKQKKTKNKKIIFFFWFFFFLPIFSLFEESVCLNTESGSTPSVSCGAHKILAAENTSNSGERTTLRRFSLMEKRRAQPLSSSH